MIDLIYFGTGMLKTYIVSVILPRNRLAKIVRFIPLYDNSTEIVGKYLYSFNFPQI